VSQHVWHIKKNLSRSSKGLTKGLFTRHN
jgi:hypothetical protein